MSFYIVKKGINHSLSSKEACLIMLIESKTTEHKGKVKSIITKSIYYQKYWLKNSEKRTVKPNR